DLPWSIWATMEKLRMWSSGTDMNLPECALRAALPLQMRATRRCAFADARYAPLGALIAEAGRRAKMVSRGLRPGGTRPVPGRGWQPSGAKVIVVPMRLAHAFVIAALTLPAFAQQVPLPRARPGPAVTEAPAEAAPAPPR